MRIWTALACIVAAGGLIDQAAAGVCGQHDVIKQQLADQYEEQADSMGLTSDGNLLEVFLSEKGTWTVLVTSPKGVTCVVAVGEAWEQMGPRGPEV